MEARIGVTVRVRPMLESEKSRSLNRSKLTVNRVNNSVSMLMDDKTTRTFKFDQVFDDSCDQSEFFEQNQIDSLLAKVIEGYHSTVFAYGQTGSGKTFSMEGFDYEATAQNTTVNNADQSKPRPTLKPMINFDKENKKQGIIPRTISRLFERVEAATKKNDRIYKVYVSYLQIYNEKIYDLLDTSDIAKKADGQGLRLRWSKKDQFQVENLFVFECGSQQEAFELLAKGISNKVMASHKLNSQSSRSHCIFQLKVESMSKDDMDNVISAKLHLVDLAGSERQSLTGTEGQNFKECIEINKSLFTLRQVITALAEQHAVNNNNNGTSSNTPANAMNNNNNNNNANQKIHVPYRDSKLTSLLKQSIGGSSYCLMIACLSPCDVFYEENMSTLQYATKAGQITNDPTKNEDPKSKLIRELRAKVDELTKNLARANEHIGFLSQFSTENINKYGASLLSKGQKPSEYAAGQQPPLSNYDSITPARQSSALNDASNSLQSSCKKALANMTSDINVEGSFMTSDMIVKRLVESANMVRDLLQSNINMREMIDKLTKNSESFESELAILQNENSDLREKIEIMETVLSKDISLKACQDKFDYKTVLEEEEESQNTSSAAGVVASTGSTSLTGAVSTSTDATSKKFPFNEIINEIHMLRKEKKQLNYRLKSLEIENSQLHTKMNPNTLYAEPFRLHNHEDHMHKKHSHSHSQQQQQHQLNMLLSDENFGLKLASTPSTTVNPLKANQLQSLDYLNYNNFHKPEIKQTSRKSKKSSQHSSQQTPLANRQWNNNTCLTNDTFATVVTQSTSTKHSHSSNNNSSHHRSSLSSTNNSNLINSLPYRKSSISDVNDSAQYLIGQTKKGQMQIPISRTGRHANSLTRHSASSAQRSSTTTNHNHNNNSNSANFMYEEDTDPQMQQISATTTSGALEQPQYSNFARNTWFNQQWLSKQPDSHMNTASQASIHDTISGAAAVAQVNSQQHRFNQNHNNHIHLPLAAATQNSHLVANIQAQMNTIQQKQMQHQQMQQQLSGTAIGYLNQRTTSQTKQKRNSLLY